MFDVTPSVPPVRSAPSASNSSEAAEYLSKAFQSKVRELSPTTRRKFLCQTFEFIQKKFPEDISEFQKSLRKRKKTLAHNSSETSTESISPFQQLIDNSQCPDLPIHLSDLVQEFNSQLARANKQLELFKSNPDCEFFLIPTFDLSELGKHILNKDNKECHPREHYGEEIIKRAKKTQENLENWNKSIKILCDGICFKSADSGHNAINIEKVKSFLESLGKLPLHKDKINHQRICAIGHFLEKGIYQPNSHYNLTNLILNDFIASGDVLVFKETMNLLFSFYDFTPYKPFDEIPKSLNDTINTTLQSRRSHYLFS